MAGTTHGREVVRLWTVRPRSSEVTPYDMRNLALFSLLLDAEREGVSEFDMARVFFDMKNGRNWDRMRTVVQTHLERARWLRDNAFPMLDW
jgi:hypothetical protein